VKARGRLPATETVPEPVSVERNRGTTAVAVVFEVVFALVEMRVGLPWLAGSDHSTCAVVPTGPNRVPVKVTVVPAHASLGLTELTSAAEAAWAPRRGVRRARAVVRRVARGSGRRLFAPRPGVRVPVALRALRAVVKICLASLIA
jgi:hypothetical protein